MKTTHKSQIVPATTGHTPNSPSSAEALPQGDASLHSKGTKQVVVREPVARDIPATIQQTLLGILNYLPFERGSGDGLVMNRYTAMSCKPRAHCLGMTAQLAMAMTRVVDRVRMELADDAPPALRNFACRDFMETSDLRSHYPQRRKIWALNVRELVTRIESGNITEIQLFNEIKLTVYNNFRVMVYGRNGYIMSLDKQGRMPYDQRHRFDLYFSRIFMRPNELQKGGYLRDERKWIRHPGVIDRMGLIYNDEREPKLMQVDTCAEGGL